MSTCNSNDYHYEQRIFKIENDLLVWHTVHCRCLGSVVHCSKFKHYYYATMHNSITGSRYRICIANTTEQYVKFVVVV